MSMIERSINIAFICDDNYAICTGVAISSLKRYRNVERDYRVYIIAKDVSEKNCNLFKENSTKNFEVFILDAKEIANYSNFDRTKYAQHVSESALYKFNIPDFFPDISKILYLDGDILIRDDLTSLYDCDISDVYAAVCKDIGAEIWPSPFNQRLKIKYKNYFNTGVMLLNLDKLRQDDITAKLLEYRINGINHYMDQDAFNVVFREKVIFIPFLYNMAVSSWYKFPVETLNHYYKTEMELKEFFWEKARILHLTTPEKPWKYSNVLSSEEWLAEYIASSFYCSSFDRDINLTRSIREKVSDEVDCFRLISNSRPVFEQLDNPKISVIVPVYNAEKYLSECVESLMFQSFRSAEFIFVDDGSTDQSVDLLRMYQKLDGRISIYRQSNSGAGAARNTGMSYVKGEFVTFLDSDDIMIPNALEVFYRQAIVLNVDMVVSSAYVFGKNSKDCKVAEWCLRKEYLPIGKAVFSYRNHSKYLFQITTGAPWGKFYRRKLITDYQLTFPELPRSEDFCFVYEAFVVAKSITTLDEKLVKYRMIENSDSLEQKKDCYPTALLDGYEILWMRLKERGLDGLLKQTFLNAMFMSAYYNFNTFRTGTAYEELFNRFRNEAVEYFDISFDDDNYYYVKKSYMLIKEICESNNFADYIFSMKKGIVSVPSGKKTTDANVNTVDFYQKLIASVEASWSFRIGRFITFIPRKVRDTVKRLIGKN